MSSPSKSCDLDPIPTILLKACLDVLIKPITDIINASLCYGFFPDDFKCAHVNPVLKKSTLPKEELNSYRPISNLSFISKILEKVVANRLRSTKMVYPMCRSLHINNFILQKLLF